MPSLRVPTLLTLGALAADPAAVLRVIRVTPLRDAAPSAVISVTFDRPVAGSLDRSVDPAAILTVSPAIQGTLDWRDPVTLRLRPTAPLPPGATYTVTVGAGFTAMDGSRLPEPYRFSFRVTGPRILTGLPASGDGTAQFLGPSSRFQVLLSSAADSALLARLVYLELRNSCSRPGVVRLQPGPQTPIPEDAPWQFREAGGWERDRSVDHLRRLVSLTPEVPLPLGCAGELVMPTSVDPEDPGDLRRWGFSTYGDFHLVGARCGAERFCPTGPISLEFSTPVSGSELLRHLTVLPRVKLSLSDTTDRRPVWTVWAELKPRTGYLVELDITLADAFGQRLRGNPRAAFGTTSYAPRVTYLQGRAMVERNGPHTLAVTYVNADTLDVLLAPVPDSLEARFLSRSWYAWREDWQALKPLVRHQRIAVGAPRDRYGVYGVPIPAPDASDPRTPTLFAVVVTSPRLEEVQAKRVVEDEGDRQPIALVQVTDLGVHAKIGVEEGVVWVTGASDGRPRAGAAVLLHDGRGRIVARARTGADGIARFSGLRQAAATAGASEEEGEESGFEGHVEVRLGADRALVGVNQYDPDLSPWRFNVSAAWGNDRFPAAAAVFTERGIYRPGDSVQAKLIARTGALGALKVPPRGDSVRVVFQDRDGGTLAEATVAPSGFGTAHRVLHLPADAPLGRYAVTASLKRAGEWRELARAEYRVAEYRPPEFLVDVTADTAARQQGDTLRATIGARYLFGAPMARAAVTWSLRQRPLEPWAVTVPNTAGYFLGSWGWWWEEFERSPGPTVTESRSDTLDATGHLTVRAPLQLANPGRAAQVSLEAVVTDVNRQSSYAAASVVLHPADFYLGARPEGRSYFWTAGTPQAVEVIAVRPDGARVTGVAVRGAVVRREWHQVRRESEGYAQVVGEWVADTVARCTLRTGEAGATCRFTPPSPGSYVVQFGARDSRGREVASSFYRWVTGPGWVPWSDESQFKMEVVPDQTRYSVGDTATVLFASPFTGAEAWVTVEREGVIAQRRLRLTDGATTLKFPITETWAPNVYLGIVVARGRSAKPGPLDDPGRPTIRVGYAEIRVAPERKRLALTLAPDRTEYRPGDSARVGVKVRDVAGRGARSEVTLWAVDEGVLALTGYATPDPIDLLYQARGLGLRLGSNLASVAPQVPAGDKGRNPGGGGGEGAAEILRSRFRTTAFFLAAVVTDSSGNGAAAVRLPDNLTTFRLMAVAVTAGDRYGKGQSSLLVTRPLLARAALPRFLRPGDRPSAGVVVNHRTGLTPAVRVSVQPRGAVLEGAASRDVTLEAGRGREVRFGFLALPGDSAAFRFDVSGAGDRDAVLARVPIRPAFAPRAQTVAGVLPDTASAIIDLPPDLDLTRSRLTLSLGSSPLALLRGYANTLRVYPYYCSEQVSSMTLPLIALFRARKQAGAEAGDTVRLRNEITAAVATLGRRQRADGGIGLWAARDWSSPWLTAYAGSVLLEARAAGIPVRDTLLAGMVGYLQESLRHPPLLVFSVAVWDTEVRARLAERMAVAEFLSRAGRRDRALENELLRQAAQLAPEDRMTLAGLLGREGDPATGRRLLQPFWAAAGVEGRVALLPDSLRSRFYLSSAVRTSTSLLLATLAVDPAHPLLGPLLEGVVQLGRARADAWNTQDYGLAVRAVDAWQRRFPVLERRGVRVLVNRRPVWVTPVGRAAADTTVPLAGLVSRSGTGQRVALSLEALGAGAPAFYYLTLTEVPREPPLRPESQGLVVERWYEDFASGKPVMAVSEGDLVRVRLRVTVPAERAFVVLDDPLPAGLEAVDLSLRTVGGLPPGAAPDSAAAEGENRAAAQWEFGGWDGGWWTPFDHREIRDDRVVYVARTLWAGAYTATYVARATTPGTFVRPQARAEEMYNPAVYGRSDGGTFVVRPKGP